MKGTSWSRDQSWYSLEPRMGLLMSYDEKYITGLEPISRNYGREASASIKSIALVVLIFCVLSVTCSRLNVDVKVQC